MQFHVRRSMLLVKWSVLKATEEAEKSGPGIGLGILHDYQFLASAPIRFLPRAAVLSGKPCPVFPRGQG